MPRNLTIFSGYLGAGPGMIFPAPGADLGLIFILFYIWMFDLFRRALLNPALAKIQNAKYGISHPGHFRRSRNRAARAEASFK